MSDVIVVQDVYKQFGKRGQPLWIRKFWHKKQDNYNRDSKMELKSGSKGNTNGAKSVVVAVDRLTHV